MGHKVSVATTSLCLESNYRHYGNKCTWLCSKKTGSKVDLAHKLQFADLDLEQNADYNGKYCECPNYSTTGSYLNYTTPIRQKKATAIKNGVFKEIIMNS